MLRSTIGNSGLRSLYEHVATVAKPCWCRLLRNWNEKVKDRTMRLRSDFSQSMDTIGAELVQNTRSRFASKWLCAGMLSPFYRILCSRPRFFAAKSLSAKFQAVTFANGMSLCLMLVMLTGCGSESTPADSPPAPSAQSIPSSSSSVPVDGADSMPHANVEAKVPQHTQKSMDGMVAKNAANGENGDSAALTSHSTDLAESENQTVVQPEVKEVSPSRTSEPAAIPDQVRERLEKMAEAYAKTNVYSDQGMIYVRGQNESDEPIDMDIPFVTVLERPNHLRLEAYTTTMIADGRYLVAFIDDFPNQVLRRAAPQTLAVGDIFADPFVTESLSQGAIFRGRLGFTQSVAWLPPPLLLLLDDQPLRTLLDQAISAEILPSETYRNEQVEPAAEFLCDRVKIVRPDGEMVLWIDAKTEILRKMEYPIAEYPQLKNFSITADFLLADFAQTSKETVFAYEIPDTIPVQERLLPPREPAVSVIGKPVPDFVFSSTTASADGENGENSTADQTMSWTPKSCADRPLLLVFWATYAPESLDLLDALEPIAEKYRDKIRILAVNTDASTVTQAAIDVKWRAKNDTMLSVRDTAQPPIAERFGITSLPTTYFVGTNGNVQDLIVALPIRENTPKLLENVENKKEGESKEVGEESVIDVAGLESRISQMLVGNGLATQRLTEIDGRWNDLMTKFEVTNTEYQQWLKAWLVYGRYRFVESLPSNMYADASENGGNPKILPATPPQILKPRTTVTMPQIGALTTVTRTDSTGKRSDTLYGLRNWANFVEFDASAAVVREVPMGKTSQDILSSLRFAKDEKNGEWWVAFGSMAPRIYCFDTTGAIRWTYPEKIPNLATAKGVVDVEIVDVDGDGTPEIVVGLSGSGLREEDVEGGILCLDSTGKQKWWNPQVLPAQKFTMIPESGIVSETGDTSEAKNNVDETKNELLVVPSQNGTLVLLDPKTGQERRRLEPEDSSQWVPWVTSAKSIPNANPDDKTAADSDASNEIGKNTSFAGLRFNQLGGDWSVVAFGRDGQPLWTTPIGSGNYALPVEQLSSANFAASPQSLSGNGWLVPGPDGTFSILSSEGAMLEHFATGKSLTGVAVVQQMDGETVTDRVVLSDADGLTIFDVP